MYRLKQKRKPTAQHPVTIRRACRLCRRCDQLEYSGDEPSLGCMKAFHIWKCFDLFHSFLPLCPLSGSGQYFGGKQWQATDFFLLKMFFMEVVWSIPEDQ